MPKFFVTKQQIKQQIEIVGEDAKHIKTVLRKKEGEENNEENDKLFLIYMRSTDGCRHFV